MVTSDIRTFNDHTLYLQVTFIDIFNFDKDDHFALVTSSGTLSNIGHYYVHLVATFHFGNLSVVLYLMWMLDILSRTFYLFNAKYLCSILSSLWSMIHYRIATCWGDLFGHYTLKTFPRWVYSLLHQSRYTQNQDRFDEEMMSAFL